MLSLGAVVVVVEGAGLSLLCKLWRVDVAKFRVARE